MPSAAEPGRLYLVPTPIGNLGDITARSRDVLAGVAVVAAEDTRKARTLLNALEIKAKLVSYYDFNEVARTEQLLRVLEDGQDVAVVCDAGTPLVNDPGHRIVSAAIAAGITVHPLPGACAAVTALIGSGLPSHRFTFAGFLPRKSAARRAELTSIAVQDNTLIFYEAPHRLLECLADLQDVLGDRNAAVARNLTKRDERYWRGSLSAILGQFADEGGEVRGEYCVMVAGADRNDIGEAAALADRLAGALLAHQLPGHVVRDVIKDVTGLPRNLVYERVQLAQQGQPG